MKESEFTRKVVGKFFMIEGLVYFKHADRFTVGIPDLSVTCVRRTTWLELKSLKRGETAVDRVSADKLQLATMIRLELAGYAWYAILAHGPIQFWRPSTLKRGVIDGVKVQPDGIGSYDDLVKLVKGELTW